MQLLDLETRETLSFVLRSLPPPPTHVLEVGCGAGHLARALNGHGHEVVALEPKPEAVLLALDHGVDVRRASFPEQAVVVTDEAPFDVVLYARSLHHLADLPGAMATAQRLLRPGGWVVVEDWAWDEVDVATIGWFTSLVELGEARGWFELPDWPRGAGALAGWRDEHGHAQPFHRELALAREHFEIGPPEAAPYFYRYLWRALADHPQREEIGEALLRHERQLIASGTIRALGRRFVGRRDSLGARD